MKKIFAILALCMVTLVGCNIKDKIKDVVDDPPVKESIPLMEFDKYKDFILENVESLSIIRYTEGGDNETKITEWSEIQAKYNMLSSVHISGETNMACEDNTTVYRFTMKDGTTTVFEFECDWIVIGSKRYLVDKNK